MTARSPLHTALRTHARGLYPTEASIELVISHGSLLLRSDFRDRYIHLSSTSITDGTTSMAAINWPAVTTALNTGHLPCSGGEQRILRIAASLAHGTPSTSATPSAASTTTTSNG